jgi:hypothetical protein
MKDKKFLMSMVTLIVIAVVSFLIWYVPHYSLHSIKATNMCNEIYKEKFPGYFGDEGTNRYIFNKKMNTCLILNTISGTETGENRFVIVDLISDDLLFFYQLPKDQTKDATFGLTKDEALERVRNFGFIVF